MLDSLNRNLLQKLAKKESLSKVWSMVYKGRWGMRDLQLLKSERRLLKTFRCRIFSLTKAVQGIEQVWLRG